MKKHSIVQLIMILMILLTSCAGNNTAAPTSTLDPNLVAAAASTFIAGVSTATPLPELMATVAPVPEPQTLLPRSLYYLAQDANGKGQIYHLSRDGAATTQITFEQNGVANFDISPVDGTVAYIVQNDLITTDANGQSRQVLTQDSNIAFLLTWSPDGQTIAFGKTDVVFYSLATGNKEAIISGSRDSDYWPASFSPDSSKLILWEDRIPSGPGPEQVLVYDLASRTLIPAADCAGRNVSWHTPESIFCYKHVFAGGGWLGLSRVNVLNGAAERLISSDICPPCLSVAAPYMSADGNLYYLYAEVHDVSQTSPLLLLVRSAPDGASNREILRPEAFHLLTSLWSPDGNALLIVQNDGFSSIPTNLVLVPIDPVVPVITIMADASKIASMHWGP